MIPLIAQFEGIPFPGGLPGLVGLLAGLLLGAVVIITIRRFMSRSPMQFWLSGLIGLAIVGGGVGAGFAYRVYYQPWVHSLQLGFKEIPPERIDRVLELRIAAEPGVLRSRVTRNGDRITVDIESRGNQRFSVLELCKQLGYGERIHYSGHIRFGW